MAMITNKKRKTGLKWVALILLGVLLCGCQDIQRNPSSINNIGENEMNVNSTFKTKTEKPYAVTTVLKESSAVNPDTGTGIYVRYTVLTVADDAPETFKNAITACNRRAEEAAGKRMRSISSQLSATVLQEKTENYRFDTYAYIVAVARADSTAFSILETEYETVFGDTWYGKKVVYKLNGRTFDTASGKEISLSELVADEKVISERLKKALQTQYGISGLASIEPSDYAWTADAFGIRFYFNSDAAAKKKHEEIGDYSNKVITVAFPYDSLDGLVAATLADVPEDYIARLDRENIYKLPHGNLSVMLTKSDKDIFIRMIPDKGEESSLRIEYADDKSDFYIIRSLGGIYLFREYIPYQDGFFYDFSNPDGGFGRFKYNISQYFDSFMNEIGLALPYNPFCVHMSEIHRYFGERSQRDSFFVPSGHYYFPDKTEGDYKRFVLIDGVLQIDTCNTACRLLEDMTAMEIDEQGKELGNITIKAGSAIVFESAIGESEKYQTPFQRWDRESGYIYDCRLADGRKVRITSEYEGEVFVNGIFLNRFTKPVSLAEARFDIIPPKEEVFTVRIGNKDYPVIPDYSKPDHYGEEIDFGDDIWWQVEEYVGQYEISDEDLVEMKNSIGFNPKIEKKDAMLMISEDGKVRFEYYGKVYEGELPKERYYGVNVAIKLKSGYESRSFEIILRDTQVHDAPSKITFYSSGLPATNKPSEQPPLSVYLTKIDTPVSKHSDDSGQAGCATESETPSEDEVICFYCSTKVKKARFCSECGVLLLK
ncbi:hypothetical protein EII17_07750 [Clostridiales bacterium COT073_COT-073]|nr:hypothetical protein EII17_07750 [Clostridiales bacterium COT073_COT-073]